MKLALTNEIIGVFFTGIIMIRNMCIINANLMCSSIVKKILIRTINQLINLERVWTSLSSVLRVVVTWYDL